MKTGKKQPDGVIVKYFTGMLINRKGIVNLELSELKIVTGPGFAEFAICFTERLATDCFGYPTDRPYLKQ